MEEERTGLGVKVFKDCFGLITSGITLNLKKNYIGNID
jgi:hypothetical protein